MSLVMAAISKRSRSRLHSQSISAVLPEPTGPPTPTRSRPCTLIMAPISCGHSAANATAFETPELPDYVAPMIANPTAHMAMTLRALTRKEFVADGVIHLIGIVAGLGGAATLVIATATRGSPLELAA